MGTKPSSGKPPRKSSKASSAETAAGAGSSRAQNRESGRKTQVVVTEVLPAEPSPKNVDENLHENVHEAHLETLSELGPELGEEDAVPEELLNGQSEEAEEPVSSELEESSRALSPQDPLRRYMEELRRYPLLPPEEELRLAYRLRDQGDIDAARKLVQANLRLVAKIAFEYRSLYVNVLDLIQEGNIGLMKAVSKFDPTRGARLGYYASWWIRSYILKYLLDNFRLVRVGTTAAQKKLFYHLLREKQRLEAQGLLAGPRLLAEKLDVREKDIIEMEQRLSPSGADLSLDTPLSSASEGRTTTHGEALPDPAEPADETLAREEFLALLSETLPEFRATLNSREQSLLDERILSENPKTLQEIADQYGLTRERARQIEARVIEKLREFLSPHLSG
jgi:RNA polymerase sigma-32 factor